MNARWKFVCTSAAIVGLSAVSAAQDNSREGATQKGASCMTSPQVSSMIKNSKHSLAESISEAERHTGGKAIRAECCEKSANRANADHNNGTKGEAGGVMCVVTLLVDDSRLVEVQVCNETGRVIGERDVKNVSFFGGAAVAGAQYPDDSASDFAMAKRWAKSSSLIGTKVTNTAKEDLGRLEDVVVDAQSGRIIYGVLSFGGFLGMGDKLFAIPWDALELSGDAKAFVFNVTKEQLKDAQGFDKAQWPNFADETWNARTYKTYNQTPYWHARASVNSDGGEVRLSADSEKNADRQKDGEQQAKNAQGGQNDQSIGTSAKYRERWHRKATLWQKVSDLAGKDCHDMTNEDVGDINDLVIDPDGGRIMYGVLSFRGKMFAIPWSALQLSGEATRFTIVNVSKDQLTDAISFGKDNWPNLLDQRWATEMHAQFKVEPYWVSTDVERKPENR